MSKTEDIIKKLDKGYEIKKVVFNPSKESFKWIMHQKKYDDFLDLCIAYNKKVENYLNFYEKYVKEYKSVYNMLKEMENNEFNEGMDSSEMFLTSEIQKELNSFRKIKAELINQLDKISKQLGGCSRFDLKSKLKIRVAISKATRTLNKFKCVRKDIKNKMKSKSIITSDTFLHSILNYKEGKESKEDKELDYTGIVGSLVTVQNYLNKYKDNEAWKELKFNSSISMSEFLTSNPKSYEKSKKVFDCGIKMAEKFKNEGTTKTNVTDMKKALESLKSEMDNFIKDSLDRVLKIKTSHGVDSFAYTLKKEFEMKKSSWKDEFEEVFNKSPNLETFIDIYFQSRSPLMFRKKYLEGSVMAIVIGGISGAFLYALMSVPMLFTEIPLVAIIFLMFGIATLSAAILLDKNPSLYLGNNSLKAFMDAREKISKPQGDPKIKENSEKEKIEDLKENTNSKKTDKSKEKAGKLNRFINHFQKSKSPE